MYDDSSEHVVAALARRVREAARGRLTFVMGENEPQEAHLVKPQEEGGYGLDALWNDDLHHAVRVALSERTRAATSARTEEPPTASSEASGADDG